MTTAAATNIFIDDDERVERKPTLPPACETSAGSLLDITFDNPSPRPRQYVAPEVLGAQVIGAPQHYIPATLLGGYAAYVHPRMANVCTAPHHGTTTIASVAGFLASSLIGSGWSCVKMMDPDPLEAMTAFFSRGIKMEPTTIAVDPAADGRLHLLRWIETPADVPAAIALAEAESDEGLDEELDRHRRTRRLVRE